MIICIKFWCFFCGLTTSVISMVLLSPAQSYVVRDLTVNSHRLWGIIYLVKMCADALLSSYIWISNPAEGAGVVVCSTVLL